MVNVVRLNLLGTEQAFRTTFSANPSWQAFAPTHPAGGSKKELRSSGRTK
jgi:hypothetical protein